MNKIKIEEVLKFLIITTIIFEKFAILILKKSNSIAYAIYGITIGMIILVLHKKIFEKKYIDRYLILTIGVILYTILSNTVDLLIVYLVIIVFKDDKIEKLIKYLGINISIFTFGTIIASKLGIIASTTMGRLDATNNYIIRNSLGFSTPNTVFLYLFSIFCCAYIISDKIKFINIVNIIITFLIYKETNSRTGLIMNLLLLITMSAFSKREKINNKFKFIVMTSVVGFTIISILLAGKFGYEENLLNKILSDRLYLWKSALERVPKLTLLHNSIGELYLVDNMFLTIWLRYGVICYIIYNVICVASIKKIDNNKILNVLYLYNVYGLMESNLVYDSNISMFILMYYLLKEKSRRENR